jgi:hypothetical protein
MTALYLSVGSIYYKCRSHADLVHIPDTLCWNAISYVCMQGEQVYFSLTRRLTIRMGILGMSPHIHVSFDQWRAENVPSISMTDAVSILN